VSPEDGFLQDILDHPDDDAPRLIYADWLEDHGQAESAEFIRVQIEHDRLAPTDDRREALAKRAKTIEKKHAKEWLRPLRAALDRPRCRQLGSRGVAFRRGFVEALSLTPQRPGFLTDAQDFLRRHPVQALTFTGTPILGHAASLAELAGVSCLRALRSLRLCGATVPTGEALRLLGTSESLPRLKNLWLILETTAEMFRGLANTPLAGRLDSLWMHVLAPSLLGVLEVLTASPAFTSLSELSVISLLESQHVRRLAHSANLPALRELTLQGGGIGADWLDELFGSPLWQRLTGLTLHVAMGDAFAQRLVHLFPDSGLRRMGLTYCGLTAVVVQALVGLPAWGELEELSLAGNPLGAGSGSALASCPHLAQLRALDVYGCGLGEDDALALAASPHAANLQRLRLYEPHLPQRIRRTLKKRFGAGFDG
jgi:uncharacterized protein (TIGR02996 family)